MFPLFFSLFAIVSSLCTRSDGLKLEGVFKKNREAERAPITSHLEGKMKFKIRLNCLITSHWSLWNSVISYLQFWGGCVKLPYTAPANLKFWYVTLATFRPKFFISTLWRMKLSKLRGSQEVSVFTQMNRSWTGLSWTRPRQSAKGSDTAMKDNAYRISAYGTKRGSQEDTALKEGCKNGREVHW